MNTNRSDSGPRGQSVIAGTDSKDFFNALFGLGSEAKIVNSYRNTSQTASSSFSYTAGSWARNQSPPSLILGGFDRSRISGPSLEARIRNTTRRCDPAQFLMQIQSIIIAPDHGVSTNITSLTVQGGTLTAGDRLPVYIDPVIPQLRLPLHICKRFEDAFGLVWDETVQLYLMNQSTHGNFLQLNATVSFKLTSSLEDSASFITIPRPPRSKTGTDTKTDVS